MFAKCKHCDSEFKNISQHWAMSSNCHSPELTNKQQKVASGLILGDGSIVKPTKNSRLQVNSTNKEYLQHLHSDIFANISSGEPVLKSTAEESASLAREGGLQSNAVAENYNDIYEWRTICLPSFNEWRKVQNNRTIRELIVSPLMMKHWYVSDGSYFPDHGRGRIKISVWNYRNKKEDVLSMFDGIPVSTPTWKKDDSRCSIVFTASGTEEMFDYMEEQVPGFQEKWRNA